MNNIVFTNEYEQCTWYYDGNMYVYAENNRGKVIYRTSVMNSLNNVGYTIPLNVAIPKDNNNDELEYDVRSDVNASSTIFNYKDRTIILNNVRYDTVKVLFENVIRCISDGVEYVYIYDPSDKSLELSNILSGDMVRVLGNNILSIYKGGIYYLAIIWEDEYGMHCDYSPMSDTPMYMIENRIYTKDYNGVEIILKEL